MLKIYTILEEKKKNKYYGNPFIFKEELFKGKNGYATRPCSPSLEEEFDGTWR